MTDDRERVRQAANILTLVEAETRLKKRGSRWVGLCPFHTEKDGSLYVTPDTGLWHCFSCKRGGDVFSWVMEVEGVEFGEALEMMANQFGIELTGKRGPDKRPQLQMLEDLAVWLGKVLLAPAGETACRHLERKGFDPQTLESYGVGAFPPNGGIAHWVKGTGAEGSRLDELGLLVSGRDGGTWEPFANRLSFTIRDHLGRVRGFAGRQLYEEDHPKYRNSPQSSLFDKSRLIYNLDKARKAKGPLILCEGYTDVLRFEVLGIKGAIASMGTALTPFQAQLIRRFKEQVVVVMDADEAGQKAADRSLGVLMGAGIEATIVVPPDGSDPDEWLRKGGKKAWEQAKREDALSFRLGRLVEAEGGIPLSGPKSQRVLQGVHILLEGIQDPLLRTVALETAGQATALPLHVLTAGLDQAQASARPEHSPNPSSIEEFIVPEEREMVRFMLQHPARVKMTLRVFESFGIIWNDPTAKEIAEGVLRVGGAKDDLLESLGEGASRFAVPIWMGEGIQYPEEEGESLAQAVVLSQLKGRALDLRGQLKRGEATLVDVQDAQSKVRAITEEGLPGWDDL
ncbi:DNA primase [bacterium]|nr:DNA primase [bacterium]